MKILSFGEVLWDVYPQEKHIGGAPLNFAAHLAKHGEDVAILTAVGCDELGAEAEGIIKKWGVSTRFIEKTPQFQTGKCLVILNEQQIPSYDLLSDVAYDNIKGENVENGEFDILYFGTLALRGKNNRKTLSALISENPFKEVFVDVNIRPPFYSDETVKYALENATMLKISDEELPVVLKAAGTEAGEDNEETAMNISRKFRNLKLIIITMGGHGAMALDCLTGKSFRCPAGEATPVSTVGAGDSFSAGFLHKYLKGESLPECLKHAARIAAFVVSRYGAVPEYDFEGV